MSAATGAGGKRASCLGREGEMVRASSWFITGNSPAMTCFYRVVFPEEPVISSTLLLTPKQSSG